MVDFSKTLRGGKVIRPAAPVDLYETLDRRHDKGPLRPSQNSVLADWFENRQGDRDVIVKLHTGQGKTLIGLLMLQSRLNRGDGPVAYLCPDSYLIEQTCEQAKQFGIQTCRADADLPGEFLNSEKILVTSVQKMFNGLTKFGLGNRSVPIHTVLMDDAHACSDVIREASRIRIPSTEPAYQAIRDLFSLDLESQGVGTYADIMNSEKDSFLPVPYWSWKSKVHDVATILSKNTDRKSIKFAWPLVRDTLHECLCVVSGDSLEIEAYQPPLDLFGSYSGAKQRIFMSATVTDDSFLIKGLKIGVKAITEPLTYTREKWSGEKMVLIPSLLHESLSRDTVVKEFATPSGRNTSGVVGLVPGFAWTKDWSAYGSIIADKDTLAESIGRLRRGDFGIPVVLANRYNGIDLPDDQCRVLIVDSRPYATNLVDKYEEACRSDSVITLMRAVRSVEQGMGRSVRGEKDYSAIITTGADLTRLIRDRRSREFLSSQMAMQVEIGLEIAELAQEEIGQGREPIAALKGLIQQCLSRDEGWKAFYANRMEGVAPRGPNQQVLETYRVETEAESCYQQGDVSGAISLIQGLLDAADVSEAERGWYMQTLARYEYARDRAASQTMQAAAFKKNRLLLKPSSGVTFVKIQAGEGRIERIISWVASHKTHEQLDVAVSDICSKLAFGVKADKFEEGLNELCFALGFVGERPDKEWKEGPDNLWSLDQKNYILWECKNEVSTDRSDINKREADQMNRSSAWFLKHYQGAGVHRIIVHPANREASAASFLHDVQVMRPRELKKLVANARSFFKSFETTDLNDISSSRVDERLAANELLGENFLRNYSVKIRSN